MRDKETSYKVLLMGGLGNQFFQIARAIELRDKSVGVEVIYIGEKLDWLYRLGGHTKHDSWLDVSVLAENLGLNYRSITLLELLFLGFKFLFRKLTKLFWTWPPWPMRSFMKVHHQKWFFFVSLLFQPFKC